MKAKCEIDRLSPQPARELKPDEAPVGPTIGRDMARRRGVALMAAIVTLVILSLMMSAIAWQIVASGRVLHHREYELEAESLARAGIEFAAAQLLEKPDGYEEVLEPIERSRVTIQVKHEPDQANTYRISCVARFPTDVVAVVSRDQARVFQRVVDEEKGRVRLVCIANNSLGSPGNE